MKRKDLLSRVNHFVRSVRRQSSWKSLILFVVISWTFRYVAVVAYCFLVHNAIFRWTSCRTEEYYPKRFSDIPSIGYDTQPTACDHNWTDPSSISIVIFVPVHISSFGRRKTIRETWARPFSNRIVVDGKKLLATLIFVVGSSSERTLDEKLKEESVHHRDILQLSNVTDDYYNITLKIRSVLNWTSKMCPRASYVVRADSDIVLDYPTLLRFLFRLESERHNDENGAIAGYCRPYDCITRWPTSKTCLPRPVYESLLRRNYFDSSCFLPRYCFGFSYVLSMKFVEKALRVWSQEKSAISSLRIPSEIRDVLLRYWPLDDIYLTGFLAEALDRQMPRLNYPQSFTYQTKFDAVPCQGHGMVASAAYEDDEEMKRRWAARRVYCGRT